MLNLIDIQDVLMERLKKLGLTSEFGLFMKSETSKMSECLHGIHKSLHVSPRNETAISIHTLTSSLLFGGAGCVVTIESWVNVLDKCLCIVFHGIRYTCSNFKINIIYPG